LHVSLVAKNAWSQPVANTMVCSRPSRPCVVRGVTSSSRVVWRHHITWYRPRDQPVPCLSCTAQARNDQQISFILVIRRTVAVTARDVCWSIRPVQCACAVSEWVSECLGPPTTDEWRWRARRLLAACSQSLYQTLASDADHPRTTLEGRNSGDWIEFLPPQPTRGSLGASQAPPAGSGVEPRTQTILVYFSGLKTTTFRTPKLGQLVVNEKHHFWIWGMADKVTGVQNLEGGVGDVPLSLMDWPPCCRRGKTFCPLTTDWMTGLCDVALRLDWTRMTTTIYIDLPVSDWPICFAYRSNSTTQKPTHLWRPSVSISTAVDI